MFRIGFGNDIHRLETGHKLILGGVEIPSKKGAVGHSDADALTHSITDGILGALAMGDIGRYFSDQDERWNDANSFVFLAEAVRMLNEAGFQIENLDSTVSLESPKLRPFIDQIRENLAFVLQIKVGQISIKAKTAEKLGAVGEGNAIKAESIVLLSSK